MIFGFLSKFRIDIEKNPHENKTIRDQKKSRKNQKNIFRDRKIFGEKIFGKVNEKLKFQNFDFFGKFFKISKF